MMPDLNIRKSAVQVQAGSILSNNNIQKESTVEARGKRKSKQPPPDVAMFIDDEAAHADSSSTDGEGGEEDEGFIDNDTSRETSMAPTFPLSTAQENFDPEAVVRDIRLRYRVRTENRDAKDLGTGSLGPSLRPLLECVDHYVEHQLFMVHVRVGQEESYAFRVNERLRNLHKHNSPTVKDPLLYEAIHGLKRWDSANPHLSLTSPKEPPVSFAVSKYPGRFYALCPNSAWFWWACWCFPNLNNRKQVHVFNNEERQEILRAWEAVPDVIQIEVGDWVTIQNGLYKGDLGRVRYIHEDVHEAIVAVVPRLPFDRKQKKPRPSPALFSPMQNFVEVDKKRPERLGEDKYRFRGQKFVKGLLETSFSLFLLAKASSNLRDIGHFARTESSFGYLDDGEPFLQYGDKVESSETKLRGVVSLIMDDRVSVQHAVDDEGNFVEIEMVGLIHISYVELQYHVNEVRRILERGMDVRVMLGNHAGEMGMILDTYSGEKGEVVRIMTRRLETIDITARWVQVEHGHLIASNEDERIKNLLRTGMCLIESGRHEGMKAYVLSIEQGIASLRLISMTENGREISDEPIQIHIELLRPIIASLPKVPSDETSRRSPSARYEQFLDEFKGKRIFVVKHREYKGRYGYVLNTHPSRNTARIALDGYAGAKGANDHEIPLSNLISVDAICRLDRNEPLSAIEISRYAALFGVRRSCSLFHRDRPYETFPNDLDRASTPLPDENISSQTFGPVSGTGLWMIHPAVLSLFERYHVYFKKSTSGKYKNWTIPDSATTVDHTECERVKEHTYCRITARITDSHSTKSQNFEAIGLRYVAPQTPMKDKPALVIDVKSPLFGRVVRMRRFKDASRTVSQVLDETNELHELQNTQLTLLEEIK